MTPDELLRLINQAKREGWTELDLSGNALTELPSEIGLLTNLQFLNLSSNQLSTLPSEIGLLTNLRFLQLRSNRLSTLPIEISQLHQLQKLDLRGNPVPIPPEILGSKEWSQNPGDAQNILDFYFQVKDPRETEPLYEAKLLIVGEGGVGKTSLAKKLQDEIYVLHSEEISTTGIEVIRWTFPLANGHQFRVNVWDFGGQEIYHATHQLFFSTHSLYALVVDTRRDNTDLYYWLNIVELLSDNSPVIIIKNEKQDREGQVNERQLRGEFANLKEVISTNLVTNRGLTEVKEAIQRYVAHLPHIGTSLPRIWIRVRSALENYAEHCNYISNEKFFELCQLNGISDRQQMLNLSSYLHDLGVCLHFQNDYLLKKIVILKPEWCTTAVYKLLEAPKVRDNYGKFTREDLSQIWSDAEYSEVRNELLRLMMCFNFCYEIPDLPDHFIAPQLLNIDKPNYDWNEIDNLILLYTYDFMPKGILTRFIVEMQQSIEQLSPGQSLVWREGTILNNDSARAEVVEYYHLGRIRIRVSGRQKRELLSIVTHTLDKIHALYPALRYKQLIPCNCPVCQGIQNPHFYPVDTLQRFIEDAQTYIQCQQSFEMVNVLSLLNDVLVFESDRSLETKLGKLPTKILRRSLGSLTRYNQQIKAQGTALLYEAKILIVGEPGAGKTSLMKKLINPTYKIPNKEESTLGITIHTGWNFPYEQDQEINFRANIWDFGGQEVQYALHKFFLTTRSLYILVVDDREQRTQFDYWFNSIKLLGKDSYVLVVLNEKNSRSISNFDLRVYQERYSDLVIERRDVDLSKNDGRFDGVIEKVQKMLCNLNHIGDELPIGWIAVRDELEQLKDRNYIKIDEYFEICVRNNIFEEADKKLLSGYLHDLGSILHFWEDSNLYNFIFLNPKWIANAIYSFLSSKRLEDGAKFTKSWLFEYWNSKGYLYEEKLKLLSLMKRRNFDLCYELVPSQSIGSEEIFLIPQLLSNIKPEYSWNDHENLKFRFQYPFMPKGIIHQLIVRLANYLERDSDNRDLAWQSGAIFVTDSLKATPFEELTRAEVIEEFDKDGLKVINIKVSGTIHNKQLFLGNICKEIRDIHRRFQNLVVKELIPCNCEICRSSDEPSFFNYQEDLLDRLQNKVYEVECRKAKFKKIPILGLIDDMYLQQLDRNYNQQIQVKDLEIQMNSSQLFTNKPVRDQVFISYSHKDKKWFNDLKTHLGPLVQEQNLKLWDDTQIQPGDKWFDEIQSALSKTKVAVLLVTPDFLISKFINNTELPHLLNAAKEEGVKILWIPIRASNYHVTAIEKYQATYQTDRPLNTISAAKRDTAWVEICNKIQTALN